MHSNIKCIGVSKLPSALETCCPADFAHSMVKAWFDINVSHGHKELGLVTSLRQTSI